MPYLGPREGCTEAQGARSPVPETVRLRGRAAALDTDTHLLKSPGLSQVGPEEEEGTHLARLKVSWMT